MPAVKRDPNCRELRYILQIHQTSGSLFYRSSHRQGAGEDLRDDGAQRKAHKTGLELPSKCVVASAYLRVAAVLPFSSTSCESLNTSSLGPPSTLDRLSRNWVPLGMGTEDRVNTSGAISIFAWN